FVAVISPAATSASSSGAETPSSSQACSKDRRSLTAATPRCSPSLHVDENVGLRRGRDPSEHGLIEGVLAGLPPGIAGPPPGGRSDFKLGSGPRASRPTLERPRQSLRPVDSTGVGISRPSAFPPSTDSARGGRVAR